MNRVRNVGLPVGDRAFLGGERLHDAAQPREHGETAVLELLDLELFEVTRLGEAERVEAATRGDVTDGEFVEDRVGNAGTVRFGGANENDLDDENVPEGRVARAFRRERGDGARELVRDGGAVIRGAQGTGGEPRDAGAVFGGPGTGDTEHTPATVDDFTLGVLLVTERDDRGLTTTRVGTEFRVDVSLDGRGDRLGLRARKSKTSSSVIAFVVVSLFLPQIRYTTSLLDGSRLNTHTPPRRNPLKDLHPSRAGEHIFSLDRARAPARASTPRLGAFAR